MAPRLTIMLGTMTTGHQKTVTCPFCYRLQTKPFSVPKPRTANYGQDFAVLDSGKKHEPIHLGISLHPAGRSLEKTQRGQRSDDRVLERGPSPRELRMPGKTSRVKTVQPLLPRTQGNVQREFEHSPNPHHKGTRNVAFLQCFSFLLYKTG